MERTINSDGLGFVLVLSGCMVSMLSSTALMAFHHEVSCAKQQSKDTHRPEDSAQPFTLQCLRKRDCLGDNIDPGSFLGIGHWYLGAMIT